MKTLKARRPLIPVHTTHELVHSPHSESHDSRSVRSRAMSQPASLVPRAYQLEAAQKTTDHNCIVNIRTGCGKTLIAVLVIDHFIRAHPDKKCLFLVPTRALVSQQSAYLRAHCARKGANSVRVSELCGDEPDAFNRDKWLRTLADSEVLVGTPEVFKRAFVERAFLRPSDFCLIVFDECHHAVGNSPMAQLMRDSVLQAAEHERPRILGLTASFISGAVSVKSVLKKRQELEVLFQANFFSPDVSADLSAMASEQPDQATSFSGGASKQFMRIDVPFEPHATWQEPVEQALCQILSALPSFQADRSEFKSCLSHAWHVCHSLGLAALQYYVREGILIHLRSSVEAHCQSLDEARLRKAQRTRVALDECQRVLPQLSTLVNNAHVAFSPVPEFTQRVVALVKLLQQQRQLAVAQSDPIVFKGIVFVEQVALTYPLVAVLNSHVLPLPGQPMCALPVSGGSSMLDRVRSDNLSSFRDGRSAILVSTSALEEGIDVPDCSFIVRFDFVGTTKSHIQGAGRARCPNAKVFYFHNDTELEVRRAAIVEQCAADTSLNQSPEELLRRLEVSNPIAATSASQFTGYPFRLTSHAESSNNIPLESKASGEVNLFNCTQVLNEYVQRVMRQQFKPEQLFEYKTEPNPQNINQVRRLIVAIYVPTPLGILRLEEVDFRYRWCDQRIEDVVRPLDRLNRLTSNEKVQRRAIYAAVLYLHELGLLDGANQATARATHETAIACPSLLTPHVVFTPKNKFSSSAPLTL